MHYIDEFLSVSTCSFFTFFELPFITLNHDCLNVKKYACALVISLAVGLFTLKQTQLVVAIQIN